MSTWVLVGSKMSTRLFHVLEKQVFHTIRFRNKKTQSRSELKFSPRALVSTFTLESIGKKCIQRGVRADHSLI